MGLIPSRWPGLWVNEDRVVADEGGLADAYEQDSYGIRELDGIRCALDIGAHLGGATALLHERFPSARIVAVECCPENIPGLIANVGNFAEVIQAAVTYETGELVLASTVYEGCQTTGSSVIVTREQWDSAAVPWTWDREDYHLDARPIEKVTIEQLMRRFSMPVVDLMKLDCEGSEISILRNCLCLDNINIIVGEYHDPEVFMGSVPSNRTLETWGGHLFRLYRRKHSWTLYA